MEDIFRVLEMLEQPGKKVLATITQVTGSAYKKEGSSMLFFENGTQEGMLSAGCLETDLALQAQTVFQNEKAKILTYDMREETDFAWGLGAGCNGIVDVLLEPVTKGLTIDWQKAKRCIESCQTVTLKKNLDRPEEYLFVTEKGESFGNWPEEASVAIGKMTSGNIQGEKMFEYHYRPKPRLFIFGAGPDACPLASLAAIVGFSVTVCDWREGLCGKENLPDAIRLLIGFPRELIKRISFKPDDFVVIMSHHFQRDQEFLLSMLHKKVKYLGVLGPRERTKRLLMGKNIPDWISAPVGAAIGAKGPEEIAVSIMAELIEVWRTPARERVKNLWTVPE